MKELWKRKEIKIFVFIIFVSVFLCILGIIVQGNIKDREKNVHIGLAQKYLDELDYEQAIAEYMLALTVDPENQEVKDALLDIYMDYGMSYVEKGNYSLAIEILQKGYDVLQAGALETKIAELRLEEQVRNEEEREEKERENGEAERKRQKREEQESEIHDVTENEENMEQVSEEIESTEEVADIKKMEEEEKPKKTIETELKETASTTENDKQEKIEIYKWELKQIYMDKQNDNSWMHHFEEVTLEEDAEGYYLFKIQLGKPHNCVIRVQVDKLTEIGTVIEHSGTPEWSALPVGNDLGSQYNLAFSGNLHDIKQKEKELEDKGKRLEKEIQDQFMIYVESNWEEYIAGNVERGSTRFFWSSSLEYYENAVAFVEVFYTSKNAPEVSYSFFAAVESDSGIGEIRVMYISGNGTRSEVSVPFSEQFQLNLNV